ncbi:MAG: hypothetical protein H3C57_08825, partial [Gammaproteobacteria bacterium]|nr:hypothetical protein [Gammaproteobacteria bacterium]
IDPEGAFEIARRSRGTPRCAPVFSGCRLVGRPGLPGGPAPHS